MDELTSSSSGAYALSEDTTHNNIPAMGANEEDERLDAVWAKIEEEFESNGRSVTPHATAPPRENFVLGERSKSGRMNGDTRDETITQEHVSPLMMAHPSDATLQTSNTTTTTTKTTTPLSNNNETEESLTSIVTTYNNNSQTTATEQINSNKHTLLQRYRCFLQKHEQSLDFAGNIMERFLFYGYLFKHDHRGTSIEMYYAAWNIIRWMNDVVLEGWGEGLGTTIGRREEWLLEIPAKSSSSSSSRTRTIMGLSSSYCNKTTILQLLNKVVPVLRAIVTATTCIYPAMEAWSRRRISHPSDYGTPLLPYSEESEQQHQSNQQEYETMFAITTDLPLQKRRREWEGRQCRAAQVSYRLERVRFLARLALLSISWWGQRHRRRQCTREEDDGDARRLSHRANTEEDRTALLPSLLRRGGELDPYEQLVPLIDAEEEANVVQYVGRRTGRRSVVARKSSFRTWSRGGLSSSFVSNASASFAKWLSQLASSKSKVLCIYAVGEVLHILRPLYWSRAQNKEWHGRRSYSFRKIPRNPLSYSFAIWRAWWISLLMDLVSDKLLRVAGGGDGTRRHPQIGLNGIVPPPSAEQAKLEELDWRRGRLKLYLLRSPAYNAVTRPLATLIGRIVSAIPSLGLGRWASDYALDVMSYWNDNHFMLEC